MKISFIQPLLTCDQVDKNLKHLDSLLEKIEPDTDIVVLPEMFNTGFSIDTKNAEPVNGTTWKWMEQKAQQYNMAIVGSLMIEDQEKFYNRHLFMKPDGSYDFYDKNHLFCLSPEPKVITPGTKKTILEFKGWRIALFTCYDLRFPTWLRNGYANGQYDYDLILIGAGWPEIRSHAWKTLLMARAIENQCYVVGVNRVGYDKFSQLHSGDSVILNYIGMPLCSTPAFEEFVGGATLDLTELNDARKKFPVGLDWD